MTHLKTISAPRALKVARKETTWIVKTSPGAHKSDEAIPLTVLLRDYLGLVDTRREVKYILNNKDVLVNGTKIKDDAYALGLFDIVSLPELKAAYIILVNNKAKLISTAIDLSETNIKISKILSKTAVRGNKLQLNLFDGKNVLVETKDKDKYKTGDTLVIDNSTKKITEVLSLEKGCLVYVTKGRHAGKIGKIKDLTEATISIRALVTLETKDGEITTSRDYIIVVGKDKPLLKVLNNG
jgi:small subunit ribosomal protein S4e